jgi:hypothetical protein
MSSVMRHGHVIKRQWIDGNNRCAKDTGTVEMD